MMGGEVMENRTLPKQEGAAPGSGRRKKALSGNEIVGTWGASMLRPYMIVKGLEADEFDAAVFGAAGIVGVGGDGAGFAVALGTEAAAVDAVVCEPIGDGFGAVGGELFVRFFAADVVGEAFDAEFPIRIVFQRSQDGVQSGFGIRGDVGFAGFEMEIVQRHA